MNQTAFGDDSKLNALDHSLYSEMGTARSLNTQRVAFNRSKNRREDDNDSPSKYDELMSVGKVTMHTHTNKRYTFSDRMKILSMPKQ